MTDSLASILSCLSSEKVTVGFRFGFVFLKEMHISETKYNNQSEGLALPPSLFTRKSTRHVVFEPMQPFHYLSMEELI